MVRSKLAARASWFAAILAAWTTSARDATALDPGKDISQYVEQSWGAGGTEGLPQNWVDAITQTHDGYLWLGTQEGLVRFDGARFTVFSTRTVPALRSNNVSALLVDSAGALWIGTYGGGLTRYLAGEWTTWGRKEGLGSDFVVSALRGSRARAAGTRNAAPAGRAVGAAARRPRSRRRTGWRTTRSRRSPKTQTERSGSGPTGGCLISSRVASRRWMGVRVSPPRSLSSPSTSRAGRHAPGIGFEVGGSLRATSRRDPPRLWRGSRARGATVMWRSPRTATATNGSAPTIAGLYRLLRRRGPRFAEAGGALCGVRPLRRSREQPLGRGRQSLARLGRRRVDSP